MISIICCYNNIVQLNELNNSIDNQNIDVECEKIFLDNREQQFKSAAKALNYGAKRANGELLLFVHQDIYFKGNNSLKELVDLAHLLKDRDIGGVAGANVNKGKKQILTNITHSKGYKEYTEYNFEKEYVETETIDECVIIMTKETWKQHPFDEIICNNWHFYAVEACLYARLSGGKVYTFDAEINHLSETGTMGVTYFLALFRLLKAYKNKCKYIVATTGYWDTGKYGKVIKHMIREARKKIRR